MLDQKGFDLWADGYDKTVGISDDKFRLVGQFRFRNCPIWLSSYCAILPVEKEISKKQHFG